MRPIRLPERDVEEPRCESFEEEKEVRRYERAMRAYRAHSEAYLVGPSSDDLDTSYRVQGSSGASYLVDVVDGSGEFDSCTCVDFLTNDLGICKHIEAVYRLLRSPRRAKRYQALGEDAAFPTLTVQSAGGLRLVARGGWGKAVKKKTGLTPEADGTVNPPLRFDPLAVSPSVLRVTSGAIHALAELREQAERRAHRERVLRAVEGKTLRLDLLSQPLFPYQQAGVRHLMANGRAMLADDMGLGKTVQAIAACEGLFAMGEARSALIVAPASLKHQWASEIKRYTGKDAVVVWGSGNRRRNALQADAAYKIVNYEQTWRDLELLQEIEPDVLILDEAQRAKNFRTKTAVTLRQIPSRFLFILTGTPVENRLDDLYSLIQLISPKILGPLWKFNIDFHRQSPKNGKILGYKNLAELRARVAPVLMRRRKEEVLTQLPPITFQTRYVPLSDEQLKQEEEHRQNAARIMARTEHRGLTLEEMEILRRELLKARQACNAAELCDKETPSPGSPKLDEFESIVDEICDQGTQKILVFSEWVEMLKLAAARLERIGVGYRMLHGGVPPEKRPALLEAFRADPNARVLLSSDAGGAGLNLQIASYIIHLDLPWNPARLDQRTARAHRLGQTRGVTVLYLCAEVGIERGIEGTLDAKRQIRAASLDVDSDIDEVQAPSFSVFMAQMRKIVEIAEQQAPQPPTSDAAPPLEDQARAEDDEAPPGSKTPDDDPHDSDEHGDDAQGSDAHGSDAHGSDAHGSDAHDSDAHDSDAHDSDVSGDGGPEADAPASLAAGTEGEATEPEEPSVLPPTAADAGEAAGAAALAAEPAARGDGAAGAGAHSPAPGPADPEGASATRLAGQPGARRPVQRERLRMSRVLLEAGFPAQSLRAAYEALAIAIVQRGEPAHDPRPLLRDHRALVAFLYRELLPSGRLPPQAPGVLARIHDLTALEEHDLDVDPLLAREALAEAEGWVARLDEA